MNCEDTYMSVCSLVENYQASTTVHGPIETIARLRLFGNRSVTELRIFYNSLMFDLCTRVAAVIHVLMRGKSLSCARYQMRHTLQ